MSHTVAILGAGIGAQHLDGYRALPDTFRVHTVCDLDTDRAAALAARAPGCRSTSDTGAVIGNAEIDIVDVCLPPHLHADIAIKAMQAGHHVVCEKPLAESVDAAERMIEAARDCNRLLTPIFQYRFGPAFTQLQALVDAGLTGQPQVASLETHWNRGADYYTVPWRGTWDHERGGAVLGHAIHIHDLITECFGAVTAVSAMLDTRVNAIETEDCGAITLRTASGAIVTSSITLGAASDQSRLRLVYQHLTAESGTNPYAPGQDRWRFTARQPAQQAEIDAVIGVTATGPAGYAGQFAELAAHLAGRPHRNVAADAGLRALELVAAIYRADRIGQQVPLPLAKDDPYRSDWRPVARSGG
ncbi:MAG: Gfo/Idh/MocA family oxidoreductase [Pseudomonadota bacterium]